jgi:hypothetical protein
MDGQIRLDEVAIFGEKVRFLIPHEWVEGEDEDNTYLYHAPNTDSGWLRVSLITVNADDPEERLRALLPLSEELFISEKNGNRVQPSEKKSRQDGTDLHIYRWTVGNVVPPGRVFEALFSYTILEERRDERETRETVDLLEELVTEAIFSNGRQ